MKILLDECLPKKLGALLEGHLVKTVTQAGWSGVKNGQLLKKAQTEFEVFLTVDQNLVAQQNFSNLQMGVVVIKSISNDIDDLRKFLPAILGLLKEGPFRGVQYVGA